MENKTARYMANVKHYYGFIEEINNGNCIKMKFMIMDMDFFARWLISFGKEIEIIEPEELREKIKSIINELKEHY